MFLQKSADIKFFGGIFNEIFMRDWKDITTWSIHLYNKNAEHNKLITIDGEKFFILNIWPAPVYDYFNPKHMLKL